MLTRQYLQVRAYVICGYKINMKYIQIKGAVKAIFTDEVQGPRDKAYMGQGIKHIRVIII